MIFIYLGTFITAIPMSLAYLYGFTYLVAIVSQFVCASSACQERFLILKKEISKNLTLGPVEVQNYIELCNKLLKILHRINKYLTTPMILIFLSMLIDVTFEFYDILRAIYSKVNSPEIVIYNGILWAMVEVYPFIITIYFSEKTWKAVEDFKKVGNEILFYQKIQNVHSETAFDCLMRFMKREKFIGHTIFFNLDWKLLFEVI